MLTSLYDRIMENQVWFPLVSLVIVVSLLGVVNCRDRQRLRAMSSKVFMPACQKKHDAVRCRELFDANQEECLDWTYSKGRYSGSSFDAAAFVTCAYDSKAFNEARRKKRDAKNKRFKKMHPRR